MNEYSIYQHRHNTVKKQKRAELCRLDTVSKSTYNCPKTGK